MVDQAYNRTVLYPLEKPLADDINQDSSQGDRSIRDTMFALLRGQQGFLFGGIKALPSGPPALSVLIKAGLGWQDAPTDTPAAIGGVLGLNDLSRYKPIVLAADFTAAVPSPPGANSRIDLIEVRYNRQLDNSQSRQFLNPMTDAFSPAAVAKTLDFNVDGTLAYYAAAATPTTAFAYKSGIPGVSPTPPAVDTGYLAVAYITVVSGAVTIGSGDIQDRRNTIVISPGSFLRRQNFGANNTYTPTPGTNRVTIRMVGGGGGGGGCQSGANQSAASGGASGTMVDLGGAPSLSTGPIAGGAVVIGAGGAGGIANTTPAVAGGDTTIVINGITYTAKGGGAGVVALSLVAPASVRGGRLTAGSSSADCTAGTAGMPGISTTNAGANRTVGGDGGSNPLGQGGAGSSDGDGDGAAPAAGYGGGGGGAATEAVAQPRNGGAGANGVIIIDEYT